jgi:hypothetical protein
MGLTSDIDRIALDLIERFGEFAMPLARDLAATSGKAQDQTLLPAETWKAIINTIERLWPTP